MGGGQVSQRQDERRAKSAPGGETRRDGLAKT